MANKKRHTEAEISAKLEEAQALVAQGKRQRDVARALGISVMTFHRWRKAQHERLQGLPAETAPAVDSSQYDSHPDRRQRIAELQLENSRLRRLVTDLLLEKIKLEESSSARSVKSGLAGHASH